MSQLPPPVPSHLLHTVRPRLDEATLAPAPPRVAARPEPLFDDLDFDPAAVDPSDDARRRPNPLWRLALSAWGGWQADLLDEPAASQRTTHAHDDDAGADVSEPLPRFGVPPWALALAAGAFLGAASGLGAGLLALVALT